MTKIYTFLIGRKRKLKKGEGDLQKSLPEKSVNTNVIYFFESRALGFLEKENTFLEKKWNGVNLSTWN